MPKCIIVCSYSIALIFFLSGCNNKEKGDKSQEESISVKCDSQRASSENTASDTHDKYSFEIHPNVGIGPIQLGMTAKELARICDIPTDTSTAESVIIDCKGGKMTIFWSDDIPTRIERLMMDVRDQNEISLQYKGIDIESDIDLDNLKNRFEKCPVEIDVMELHRNPDKCYVLDGEKVCGVKNINEYLAKHVPQERMKYQVGGPATYYCENGGLAIVDSRNKALYVSIGKIRSFCDYEKNKNKRPCKGIDQVHE